MHTFSFKAKKSDGQIVSGKVKAKNKNGVLFMLNARKMDAIHIELQKSVLPGGGGISSVSMKHLVVFTRQMAFLISSGIPVVQALLIAKGISKSQALKTIITDVSEDIEKGSTFASALSTYPSVFNPIYISIIEAGETGGNLDTMLNRLASYIEDSASLRSRMLKAMMYPGFVLSVGVIMMIMIMAVVVPKFTSIFDNAGADLPLMTKILVGASDFFKDNIIAIIIMVIIVPFCTILYLRSPAGRPIKDQLLMFLPVIGPLVLKNSMARFSRTFSCLLAGGVNVAEALNTAAVTSNNFFIEQAVKNVKNQVMKGKPIAQSLEKESVIPSLVSNMVAIGEETGRTDVTLEKVAEFYEEQVKTTSNMISELIQPFLIILLGGMVGFVVIALYLPIFKLPGLL